MSQTAELFIDSRCALGEGPLWHHQRQRLLWFDILNRTLFEADTGGTITNRFAFEEPVSAAGIIDRDTVAVAMSGAMLRFDLNTGSRSVLAPLEANKPRNRPNDGRVDPTGGFWIGTMGRAGNDEPSPGSVYQFKGGRLTTILTNIRVPNSICFSPEGGTAYFTNAGEVIRKCAIDRTTGLPVGEWSDFAISPEGRGHADGSVVDSQGFLWSARWGGSSVIRFAPDGSVDRVVELPVSRVTCPAFGGPDLRTLYITSAQEGLSAEQLAKEPHAGSVFALQVDVPGLPENTVAV